MWEEFRGLVYRSGNLNPRAFTPRPGPGGDTEGGSGQAPGLSTFESLELAAQPGDKAQILDLKYLLPPLKGFRDDPSSGGIEGHVSITPVTPAGDVDAILLEEWAASRPSGGDHPLTKVVLDAVVETNRRRLI